VLIPKFDNPAKFFLGGFDVIRLKHAHKDACETVLFAQQQIGFIFRLIAVVGID
jgi:hypothetical protein